MPTITFPKNSFNYIQSSPGSSFSSSSTSFVTMHSPAASLTTKGYPVVVGLMGGYFNIVSVSQQAEIDIRLTANSGAIILSEPMKIGLELDVGSVVDELKHPGIMHAIIPSLAAGTYSFEVQGRINLGNSFGQTNLILFAYELYHF